MNVTAQCSRIRKEGGNSRDKNGLRPHNEIG